MSTTDAFPALLPIEASEEERSKLNGIADILFCNHAQSPFKSFGEALQGAPDFMEHNLLNERSTALEPQACSAASFAKRHEEKADDLTGGLSLKIFVRRIHLFNCSSEEQAQEEALTDCLVRRLQAINALLPDDSEALTWQERKGVMHKWRRYVCKAYQCLYAHTDSEGLLARLRLRFFALYIESFRAKWNTDKLPEPKAMQKVAWIISWNAFLHKRPTESIGDLFAFTAPSPTDSPRVMKWVSNEPLKGTVLDFSDWQKKQRHIISHS